jgi:hypothetical protein
MAAMVIVARKTTAKIVSKMKLIAVLDIARPAVFAIGTYSIFSVASISRREIRVFLLFENRSVSVLLFYKKYVFLPLAAAQ